MESVPFDLLPLDAGGTLTPAQVIETRVESLRRLKTLLSLAEGAWAVAVFENGEIRGQMASALAADLKPLPFLEISLLEQRPDPLTVLQGIDPSLGAPVVSFYELGPQLRELCGYLDIQRESLARFSHRLLFWLTPQERQRMAESAPNFFSRLSGVFYFPGRSVSSSVAPSVSPKTQPGMLQGDLPDRQRRFSLEQLADPVASARLADYQQRRIAGLNALPKPDYPRIGEAWNDLAELYESEAAPRWPDAEAAYTEAARAFAAGGQSRREAEARLKAGVAAFRGYNRDASLLHLRWALSLFRLLDDPLGEANVLKAQGDVLAFQKQNTEALARYEAALGLFRAAGDRLGEANVLQAQGDVLRRQNDYAEATSHYDAALALYRLTGSRQGEANAYLGLGRLALAQEEFVRAREWSEQAIAFHSANQSRYDVALDCEVLAQACRAAGDLEATVTALQRASTNYQEIGLMDRFASVLTTLGDVLDEAGRKEEALAVYATLAEIQPDQSWLRRNYANSLINLGRLDEAEVQLDAAEQLEPDAPYLALRRAELAKARGDHAETVRWAKVALRRNPDWDEAQKLLDEANA